MNRRGYTLLEMVVVMACMTVMFTFISQILLRLWSTVREGREQTEVAAAVSRLGVQFRDDVHRAQSAEVTDFCRLHLADGTQIAYAPRMNGLMREESRAGAIVQRESYRLPGETKVKFERTTAHDRVFVAMNLATGFQGSAPEPGVCSYQLPIRAALPPGAAP